MTEIADDKSWWADVEHLRPGGEAARPSASVRTPLRSVAVADRPADTDADAPVRHGRITGTPVAARPAQARPAVLRRADAAAFADAWDIDGDFGAPPSRSREIVLGRSREATAVDDDAVPFADDDASTGDRRTVRITANPGLHAEVAERRPLREVQREVQPRRPRTAVDRVGARPDRIAMYIVLLGIALVLIAATTSSAGT